MLKIKSNIFINPASGTESPFSL